MGHVEGRNSDSYDHVTTLANIVPCDVFELCEEEVRISRCVVSWVMQSKNDKEVKP